jgi:hypothetical protein
MNVETFGFMLVVVGLFGTMTFMFAFPDEVEDED